MRNPIKRPTLSFAPLGDAAMTVTVGAEADDATLLRVRALARALEQAGIAGVTDVAPAYAGVTVYYVPSRVEGQGSIPFHRLSEMVARCAEAAGVCGRRLPRRSIEDRLLEIPVCYGGEFGPDLSEVARSAGITEERVIFFHCTVEYRVQAIGFAPGFPYLTGLPHLLRVPRRPNPRETVPAGSVGIGGGQTGVYPIATPGGWNLIGRTPSTLFLPDEDPPALLRVGDRVRFRPISSEEFSAWK